MVIWPDILILVVSCESNLDTFNCEKSLWPTGRFAGLLKTKPLELKMIRWLYILKGMNGQTLRLLPSSPTQWLLYPPWAKILDSITQQRSIIFFFALAQFIIEVPLFVNWRKRCKNMNCLTRFWRWMMKLMRISKESFHNAELDWKRMLRSRRRLRQNWEELRTVSSCNKK